MKKYYILKLVLVSSTISFASNVDSKNLQSMYEGAKEVKMLDKSMEAGMREHNQKVQPVLTQTTESIIDNSPVESFQDLGNRYYLEKNIEDAKNTKVKVSINIDMLKITTTTTKKEHITTTHGMAESSYSSSTVEEIPIPFNADTSKMKKEYKNGILKVSFPKSKK
jgi:HSP20 family molecular chaperone IbpA